MPAPEPRGVYRAKYERRGWLSLYAVSASGDVVLSHDEILTPRVDIDAIRTLLEARLDELDPPVPTPAAVRLELL